MMITTDKIRLLDSTDPRTFTDYPHLLHHDGRPLTADEVDLFGSLTAPDFEQYKAIWRARVDQAEASADTADQLVRLLAPYHDQYPSMVFGDLLPQISEPDRSQVIALARVLSSE